MLILLALLAGSAGAPSPIAQVETLHCGAADLRMTSYTYPGRMAPLAPAHQELTRRIGARQIAVSLEPPGNVTVQGVRVSGRYVASWACLAAEHRAHYVLLQYACTDDSGGASDCGGEKEWFRVLDRRGLFVDADVPHDGPARDELNARLGIASAMAAGVTMTAVVK